MAMLALSIHARYMLVLCGHYANNHATIKLAESVILILYVWRHKDAKNHYYHLLKLSDFTIKSSESIPD